MMQKLRALFLAEELKRNKEDVNRQNRTSIHVLAIAGLPFSIANVFAQFIVVGRPLLAVQNLLVPLYFLLLLLLDVHYLDKTHPRSLLMLYIAESPLMLLAVLLGTVWDPVNIASTFLLFLVFLPVFLLDRPGRVFSFQFFWCVLFSVLSFLVKERSAFLDDFIHMVEFFIVSMTMTLIIMWARLASLQHRERTQYLLEHDELTGALSRLALENRQDALLGRNVTVVMADLDQLNLYNDFYGHKAGDSVFKSSVGILIDTFGADRVFRYSGDEILCVAEDMSEVTLRAKLYRCRIPMHRIRYEDNSIPVTCAFGFTYGTPSSPEDVQNMLRLADIYAHSARKKGEDQMEGGPYGEEQLRLAILDSNLNIHSHAYEINQLTGLPSLTFFVARVNDLLQKGINPDRPAVLGYFNLVRFRSFNEQFGYSQGDALIRYTAQLLKEHLPNRHLCYLTGCRFGIFCYRDEVEPAMEKINAALQTYKPGFPVFTRTGFAQYQVGDMAIALMDRAKVAHDSISHRPNLTVRFYDDELDKEDRMRQYIIRHVGDAIEKGWHLVYYQPIVRTLTSQVCNEEALSRWDDPTYGMLMPRQFIPVLEESGLLYKLNLNVVRMVLRDFDTKRAADRPIVPVSVNLSRHDFEQCDMVSEITRLMDEAGYPHRLLAIEITESAFIQDQELLKRQVQRFRANGFQVWVDDFGSEYSTLNLLTEMDFDLIKIDMKFMRDFAPDSKNAIIVSSVLNMARQMGIVTLIEGVETAEQYYILRRLGCEKLQGYFFNTPNSMAYIMQVYRNTSRLEFERSDEEEYLSRIHRVDLSSPLSGVTGNASLLQPPEMPAGVFEYQDGEVNMLRCTGRLIHYLRERNFLPEGPYYGRVHITVPISHELRSAMDRCRETTEWVKMVAVGGDEMENTFLLRKVSENPADRRFAVLLVLLPKRLE